MKPILSIVTITYNDGPGLDKTLKSLQTLSSDNALQWEHIIVDSSPEVSSKILSQYPGWPVIRIKTSPQGIYPAFNLGIERAQGEFIWFLNSGDRLLQVENLKKVLEAFNVDGSLDLICAPVEIFRENKFTYFSRVHTHLISNLLGQNNLCHQGIIYRRSVFSRVGKFDESFKLAGDYEHHFKCYLRGMKFGALSTPVAQYDRDGRSDNYREVFKEYRRVWGPYRGSLENSLKLKNDFLATLYYFRLKVMKSKYLGPLAKPLRAVWCYVNKNTGSKT